MSCIEADPGASSLDKRRWVEARNEYVPHQAEIIDIDVESSNTYLITLKLLDDARFDYRPGQFAMVSVFGLGECPISITSTPTRDALQFCVRRAGKITSGIMDMRIGDVLGVRGPYGNGFPIEKMKKDIIIAGGGSGFAALRSLVNYIMDRRESFGRVVVVYGARTKRDLYFMQEYQGWTQTGIEVGITVDIKDDSWTGHVGLVTSLLDSFQVHKGSAAVCGPSVMINAVSAKLLQNGLISSDIYVSMERHMKCGIGKCEHCVIGPYHACLDGPVFSYDKIKSAL